MSLVDHSRDINVQYGNVLRMIREARKMTQADFAELCGISRAYYGRIERGEHSVTLYICQRIAEATGMELVEFFKEISV